MRVNYINLTGTNVEVIAGALTNVVPPGRVQTWGDPNSVTWEGTTLTLAPGSDYDVQISPGGVEVHSVSSASIVPLMAGFGVAISWGLVMVAVRKLKGVASSKHLGEL